jgi:hypothetical protein
VAIGLTVGSTGHGPAAPKILRAEAQEKFPSETLSDVVSWSDQVSIVTAIGASEVPDSSPQSPGDDVRLIGRDITYHIDQTIWHRAGAPELTGTFTAGGGGGWETSSDHPKVRIALEGAPWVEVGEQYVMPLALDQGKWGPYSSSAVVPYVNGKVVPDPTQHTQLAEALKTLPATELSPLFATAIPDPDAARHFDLRPTDRLCAVMADRGNLEPEDRVALGCS